MRRLALLLAALTVLGGGAATAVAGLRTTYVGAGLREYRVSLYRYSVRRGIVSFSIHNYGQDPHDLAVRHNGHTLAHQGKLLPGHSGTLRARLLEPGRYFVYCTIPTHEALGMKAVLQVR